jgi:hypothetical protein
MSDVLDGLDEVVEAPADAPVEPEAAPEPEVKAEAPKVEEAKPEPKPEPQEKQHVPLAAHLEERRKWKEDAENTKAQLKALQDQLEALRNPPKAPDPEPDFVQDPKGYVDHRVTEALAKLEETGKQVETVGKTAEQAQAEVQFNRFMTDLTVTEQSFVAATPDYYDALNHIRNARAMELKILVPDITDDQVANQIRQEEIGLASQLMKQGRNPHEYAYKLAAARGYQRKAAPPVLPDVPKTPQLSPDKTLGTSGGGDAPEADQPDEFTRAFTEVFKRRA